MYSGAEIYCDITLSISQTGNYIFKYEVNENSKTFSPSIYDVNRDSQFSIIRKQI